MKKRAQIQLTFHWMYILIAGAVILLFFVGIVVKQKAAADQSLAQDLVHIMDSIFQGASVAEKTKEFIDTSGLADYTMEFSCQEGVTSFGLQDTAARTQNAILPIFAPSELQTSRLLLWSLPYRLPFKAIDFLFITSQDTKFFLIGDHEFTTKFLNATIHKDPRLTIPREKVQVLQEINPKGFRALRIVDVTGVAIQENALVPDSLKNIEDSAVSAVRFTGNLGQVTYFIKENNRWRQTNRQGPVPIISLPDDYVAVYAAVFAANAQDYQCNIQKALKRLRYVSQVYAGSGFKEGGKLGALIKDYTQREGLASTCVVRYNRLSQTLTELDTNALACGEQNNQAACLTLRANAQTIDQENNNMGLACVPLY